MPRGNEVGKWLGDNCLLIVIALTLVVSCVSVGRVADALAVQTKLLRGILSATTDAPSSSWTDANGITHIVRTPKLSDEELEESQALRHKTSVDVYSRILPARR
jgi:hypothetical protein